MVAERTQGAIDEARTGYQPCGGYNAALFFCIRDMAAVDPMYQYSLSWFISLFMRSIAAATCSEDLTERLRSINDHFTYALYQNVCRQVWCDSPGRMRTLKRVTYLTHSAAVLDS